MGIDFALEQLYQTGWSAMDTAGCESGPNGRWAPTVERVRREFVAAGFELDLAHIASFDCYRAEWRDDAGSPVGSVVGQTEQEAAVYALAQCRRSFVGIA